jgi:[ribosomal protein S5]-alanine N-acetyltransferase
MAALRLPLLTPRLELRPFAPPDAPAMHAVYSDPVVMEHVGDGPVTEPAETEAMLGQYIAHQAQHGFSFWAVVERASGALIGDAGLYLLEGGGPEVELGYTLGAAWWGRGYGTEAAGACLAAGLGPLGLDEIVAVADPANAASVRVLEKLGMRLVGPRDAYGRTHVLYRARRQATPSTAFSPVAT